MRIIFAAIVLFICVNVSNAAMIVSRTALTDNSWRYPPFASANGTQGAAEVMHKRFDYPGYWRIRQGEPARIHTDGKLCLDVPYYNVGHHLIIIQENVVPEPCTLALLGAGIFGVTRKCRRNK